MSYFSNKLKQLRTDRRVTQEALAKAICVSRSTIGMYEQGTREPSFEMLEAIADFFNVDMADLVGSSSSPAVPSYSPRALAVAAAFDRAQEREKAIVELTLQEYFAKKCTEQAQA